MEYIPVYGVDAVDLALCLQQTPGFLTAPFYVGGQRHSIGIGYFGDAKLAHKQPHSLPTRKIPPTSADLVLCVVQTTTWLLDN